MTHEFGPRFLFECDQLAAESRRAESAAATNMRINALAGDERDRLARVEVGGEERRTAA